MIYEVSGDILQSKAEWIAHGVAPDDHFQSGLALALREQWPVMVKDFRHYCRTSHPKAGQIWAWAGPHARIVNLLTQEPSDHHGGTPGRASTAHVNHALRELKGMIQKEKVKSLALPRLATGVGGLEWKEVSALIHHHLGELDIPIYVYSQFVPGQKAAEPQA